VCNAAGVSEVDDARTRGTIATVVIGVGLVGLAAGAVLFFTGAKSPSVAASLRGFDVRGVF
jgi:hypothetical protein